MSKQNEQYVQGDILFIKADSWWETDEKRRRELEAHRQDTNVVAYGEKTGHKHSILGNGWLSVVLSFGDITKMLVADDAVTIAHDEHPPLTLPKGVYDIREQKTYDYKAAAARRVED